MMPMDDRKPEKVKCPSCNHEFVVTFRETTMRTEDAMKFWPRPVRCPKCNHVWSRG